jgi:hypothetical protein
MINKESYRQFLLSKMERKTPVLEAIGANKVTTPIARESHPRHAWKRWLISALSVVAGASLALGIVELVAFHPWSQTETPTMNVAQRQYLAAKVYQKIVASDESIQYGDVPDSATSIDDTFKTVVSFSSMTVRDSFFIRTSFDSSLEPYFDDSFANTPVDTVFALLNFTFANADKLTNEINAIIMVIFCHNGVVNGFLGPGNTTERTPRHLSAFTEMSVSSSCFLSGNSYVYDKTDPLLYNIFFKKDDKGLYSISAHSGCLVKSGKTDISCSIDNSAYKPLATNVTMDLVDQSNKAKKISGVATIQSIDPKTGVLSVSCDAIPSLETVTYTQLIAGGETWNGDPQGILKSGSKISFSYYQRYEGYLPKNLTVGTITLV